MHIAYPLIRITILILLVPLTVFGFHPYLILIPLAVSIVLIAAGIPASAIKPVFMLLP